MYRFLLSRQWVILTLIALVMMPVMVELGFWQYHRHEERVAHNDRIAASLSAEPVAVTELTSVDGTVSDRERYRQVTANGSYDTDHEVVVRRRTADDGKKIGYFVLTPLVLDNGSVLLVNRGWIPPGNDPTSFPEVPQAPSGTVELTGRLMPDETSQSSGIKDREGLPERQVMLMNSQERAKAMDRPILSGYVQLVETSPTPAEHQRAQQVAEPDHTGIGAHMAYAVQWWLFVAAVPVGWVVLLRRELRDQEAAAPPTASAAHAEPGSGTDAASAADAGPGTGPVLATAPRSGAD